MVSRWVLSVVIWSVGAILLFLILMTFSRKSGFTWFPGAFLSFLSFWRPPMDVGKSKFKRLSYFLELEDSLFLRLSGWMGFMEVAVDWDDKLIYINKTAEQMLIKCVSWCNAGKLTHCKTENEISTEIFFRKTLRTHSSLSYPHSEDQAGFVGFPHIIFLSVLRKN